MTQEDKELLLKDISGRLPYGVKIRLGDYDYQVCGYNSEKEMPLKIWYYYDSNQTLKLYVGVYLTDYHPYLRPMSSMTEEEKKEFYKVVYDSMNIDNISPSVYVGEWQYSKHFDVHGLIEKGLALEAPEGMYKKEE
jgi:hypothetical protein